AGRRIPAAIPAGSVPWSRRFHRPQGRGEAPSPPRRRKPRRVGKQATRRWYRRTGSPARALGLVVKRLIPFELAHQIDQALLPAAGDELLQGARNRRLLGPFATHFYGALDQLGVQGEVSGHV